MEDDGSTTPAKSQAQINTDLATDRTLMAADRSLMAWLRTGLSMIGFGFTIYKILDAVQEQGIDKFKHSMPRNVGLFLSGMGTVAIVIGTIEFWVRFRQLRKLKPYHRLQPTLLMAIVMSAAGLFIFFGIVLRAV